MKNMLFVLLIFVSHILYAQSREKFEPPDGRVLHGLGQYAAFYYSGPEVWGYMNEYRNLVMKDPVIFSVYAFIDPAIAKMDTTDFDYIINTQGYPVLQVGLVLMDSTLFTGNVNVYVQGILNGSLDKQIIKIAQRIKKAAVPVFFRPGFEFGEGNSGIHNDPDLTAAKFIEIWKYIYQIFTSENVTNVAWVWCTVNPDEFNYLQWYPGDEYVDWWGINLFTASQINASTGFINSAAAHNKPVIICESNPIQSGGTTNSANWNNFFVPYFNKIKSNTNVKAFVYVNSPWTNEPLLDWPDSRISSNSTISNNYKDELQDSIYIHKDEYLSNPGIITTVKKDNNVPKTFDIAFKNYPNPFNTTTKISWLNKTGDQVTIQIYNVLGEKITGYMIKKGVKGKNEISWDAQSLPSGIYYAKILLHDSDKTGTIKMVLLK